MRSIKKVLIIVNKKKKESSQITSDIINYLQKDSIVVDVFSTGSDIAHIDSIENIDLAFSLGGDGTVLYASRILADYSIPIIPINLGTFGFITEVSKSEWLSAFEEYRSGL